MAADMNTPVTTSWWEDSGIPYLLRSFKLAIDPAKLVLALAAILLTLGWGLLLDVIWTASENGISANAVQQYLDGQTADTVDPAVAVGVFKVFSEFEVSCTRDAIESVRFGRLLGSVSVLDSAPGSGATADHPVRGVLTNVLMMGRGLLWLVTQHWLYALLFLVVSIMIWAQCGGAICRIAAYQLVRDEKPTIKESMSFVKNRLLGGFFLAPILPLAICLAIGVLLAIGGLFLDIPWVGDIVGGLLFFLALFGGLIIAAVAVGTVAGGSLFWPTIAVEGSDGFDAISRSFSYVYAKPLRAIGYAVVLIVFGSFSWLMVRFCFWLSLAATHRMVGIGTGLVGDSNKITDAWAFPTFEHFHAFPTELSGGAWVGSGFIALWVLLIAGLSWAFLMTFYFSGSTAAYFLLRRDVDATDLEEIYAEEDSESQPDAPAPAAVETPAAQSPAKTEPAEPSNTAASSTPEDSKSESTQD